MFDESIDLLRRRYRAILSEATTISTPCCAISPAVSAARCISIPRATAGLFTATLFTAAGDIQRAAGVSI